MKANFNFNELALATKAKIISEPENLNINYTISTDSRDIHPGNVYIPLKGDNFDGHNFITGACNQGASGYFLDQAHNPEHYKTNGAFILQVDNTLESLLALANLHRKRLTTKIVAITGSSGKTTTKELVYAVLSEKFNTVKSQMNFNNEIGVSKTLLGLENNVEVAVLEMGMRGTGEIETLAKCALPDIALITNVGTSHIGRLGSIENIALAKTELVKYLDSTKGIALLNGNDELLIKTAKQFFKGKTILFGSEKDYQLLDSTEEKMFFSYKRECYELNIPGIHNIINSSAAIELGKLLGMTYAEIHSGLKNYKPLFGRWEEYQIYNNSKLINDAYNANPDSTKAAIETIFRIFNGKKKWLVLGDMLELGEYEEDLHRNVGKWLKKFNPDVLITVGEKSRFISEELKNTSTVIYNYESPEPVADLLDKEKPSDAIILLKASRGIGLEKILNKLGLKNGGDTH